MNLHQTNVATNAESLINLILDGKNESNIDFYILQSDNLLNQTKLNDE